jgi:hypothetical protein
MFPESREIAPFDQSAVAVGPPAYTSPGPSGVGQGLGIDGQAPVHVIVVTFAQDIHCSLSHKALVEGAGPGIQECATSVSRGLGRS